MVMGTAGLWYLRRTSSCFQNFLAFMSNNSDNLISLGLPGSHVSAFLVLREAHMYPLDILGKHEGTGSETNGQQLRLQLAHALREGHHSENGGNAIGRVFVESLRNV